MIQRQTFCGIDPGQSGGIALIGPRGLTEGLWLEIIETPKAEADLLHIFRHTLRPAAIELCLIEKVGAFPGQGRTSMFTFGRGDGILIGMLLAHDIPFQEIRPQAWQKALGIRPRAKTPNRPRAGRYYPPPESKPEFKRRLLSTALRLFPGAPVNLKTADALLLAEVARRYHAGA